MKSASPLTFALRGFSIFFLAFLVLGAAASADEYCQDYVGSSLFDTAGEGCDAEPGIDRTFFPGIFHWNGNQYLMHSTGNDLAIWNVNNGANPTAVASSHWHGSVGNEGDSDHDLQDWSACDDCRYGLATYNLAAVTWDFGTGANPAFPNRSVNRDYLRLGATMTFSHQGYQYLVARNIQGACGSGAGLFLFNGLDLDALSLLQCVEGPTGGAIFAKNGLYLQDPSYNEGTAYVWLEVASQVQVYQVSGSGTNLRLNFASAPSGMSISAGAGFDVDLDQGVAVSVSIPFSGSGGELKTWSVTDLENPQHVGTLAVEANTLDMAYPVVWMARAPGHAEDHTSHTVDVSTLSAPQFLDDGFWSGTHSWNQLPCLGAEAGGVFTDDGSYLFISRWEKLQKFDLIECGDPQPPVARATLGRWSGSICAALTGSVFPGDEICVKSDSTGEITSTELWITDAGGTTVAGPSTGGATVAPLPYLIPQGGTAGEPSSAYTGRVRVSNDVGTTEDSAPAAVDLTPQATISFQPVAPLTGDDLVLTGEAEGNPALPDGSELDDPFEWTVTAPEGAPQTLWGTSPDAVDLAEAGLYEIDLTVHYRHGVAAPYTATKSLDLDISSVAAAFEVTPAYPLNTADIVLDGTDSRWSDGVTPVWKWEYKPVMGSWQDLTSECGASQTCTIEGSDADLSILTPGDYDFRLTLTNDPDVSVAEVTDVTVADGEVNIDFTWSPTAPEIGQAVGFSITGILAVDLAHWTFGGANCDGTSQTLTCDPDVDFVNCLSSAYRYASSGAKNVSLTVTANDQTYPSVSHVVTVANSGSCGTGGGGGGGGGTSCTYTLSPTTRTVPTAGGANYSITVSTQAGCAWSASDNANWVNITFGSSGSGSGEIRYDVAANDGDQRSAVVTAGGKTHTVTQGAANIPVDFTWTPTEPDTGESVTFSVTDSRVTPIRWEFDGAHCDGTPAIFDCSFTPEFCKTITWKYSSGGWKAPRLVAEQGEKAHSIHVLSWGECCFKDGPPNADFTMTPNPVFAGDDVVFTDASSKGDAPEAPKITALGFTWNPIEPAIGETVVLTVTGVGGVDSAEWDMGGAGCSPLEQSFTCTPVGLANCLTSAYQYAGAGDKTVQLTINGGQNPVTHSITVLNEGSCGGGGGGGCSYSVTPSSRNFGQDGGMGSISVSTSAGCDWTATESVLWVTITGGSSGSGSGTVSYSVDQNTGSSRTAIITVAGKNHTVRQDAYEGPQDTEPTAWDWKVSLGGVTVATSDQPTFVYVFDDPGLYDVRFEAINCIGSDVAYGQLLVEEKPYIIPEAFLVPSAVHAPGLINTEWRTDLRVFNPDIASVELLVEYQPGDTDDDQGTNYNIRIEVPPGGTRAYEDIVKLIPGIIVDETGAVSGSLNITYTNRGDDEVPPLIVSRTYNETSDGTYGQFVPVVPALPAEDNRLFLTGLVHNLYSRTNIRLANMSDESVVATITLVNGNGDALGEPIYPTVRPRSTTQVNAIAEVAGVYGDVNIFSVQVDTGSPEVSAWASVVDNSSGDPVLFSSFVTGEDDTRLWVPGVARLAGENDSEWRSDVTFFNPTDQNIDISVWYVPSEDQGITPGWTHSDLGPGGALYYQDVLNTMLPSGVESKGYLVIEGLDGSALPQVAARTYNKPISGGTFGQNLFVFRAMDLIAEGSRGFTAGVVVSATDDAGFRTNLGLLNTNDTEWAELRLTVLNEEGVVTGDVVVLWLEPGEFKQFNLADRLNLPAVEMDASVVIEVLDGGPVAGYASTVDNRTQDPILIPAIPDIHQFMR